MARSGGVCLSLRQFVRHVSGSRPRDGDSHGRVATSTTANAEAAIKHRPPPRPGRGKPKFATAGAPQAAQHRPGPANTFVRLRSLARFTAARTAPIRDNKVRACSWGVCVGGRSVARSRACSSGHSSIGSGRFAPQTAGGGEHTRHATRSPTWPVGRNYVATNVAVSCSFCGGAA